MAVRRQHQEGQLTLAGIGTPEKPHPIQKAYVEEEVPQCGYCITGWLMTAAALLARNTKPSDAQLKGQALSGLKCRCGTHMGIPARSSARPR